jgi:hypothetical protein
MDIDRLKTVKNTTIQNKEENANNNDPISNINSLIKEVCDSALTMMGEIKVRILNEIKNISDDDLQTILENAIERYYSERDFEDDTLILTFNIPFKEEILMRFDFERSMRTKVLLKNLKDNISDRLSISYKVGYDNSMHSLFDINYSDYVITKEISVDSEILNNLSMTQVLADIESYLKDPVGHTSIIGSRWLELGIYFDTTYLFECFSDQINERLTDFGCKIVQSILSEHYILVKIKNPVKQLD